MQSACAVHLTRSAVPHFYTSPHKRQDFWNEVIEYNNLVKVKVKVNFSLEQSMKAQRGTRGIDLLFL